MLEEIVESLSCTKLVIKKSSFHLIDSCNLLLAECQSDPRSRRKRDSRKMVQLQLGYLTPYADRDAPLLHELILFIDVSKIPILKERNFSNGNKDKKIPYRGITIQKRTDPETREYDLEPYPLDKNFFSYNQAKSLTCGLKLIKITWYSEVLSTYLHPNHLTINRCIGSCDVGYTDVSTDEIFNIHSFSDSRRIY
ncbi:unnamed protein product [Gordionus sp. m RMFG-2023]